MHRRTVLAAAPALLAGCLGASDGDGSKTRSTRTTSRIMTRYGFREFVFEVSGMGE